MATKRTKKVKQISVSDFIGDEVRAKPGLKTEPLTKAEYRILAKIAESSLNGGPSQRTIIKKFKSMKERGENIPGLKEDRTANNLCNEFITIYKQLKEQYED